LIVYVVRNCSAEGWPVRTHVEGRNIVAIKGPNIKEGDFVVIVGNHELKENMRVEVEGR
jgi:hypothetical protein